MRRAVRHPGTAGRVLTEQERPADVDGARAYKLGAEKPPFRKVHPGTFAGAQVVILDMFKAMGLRAAWSLNNSVWSGPDCRLLLSVYAKSH